MKTIQLGRPVSVALFLGALLLATSGCQKQEGPVERAGKQVDQAVDKVGQKIEKVGDSIQDGTKSGKN